MKTKYRTTAVMLDELGADAHIPLYRLFRFVPGRSPPATQEDLDLAEQIVQARAIHVDAVKCLSSRDLPPRIYQVTLSCIQELTLLDVRRLIALGQHAVAAEDEAELK